MTKENTSSVLDAVSAIAATTTAAAAVTGAVAASGVALGVAAVAGGVVIASNVVNKLAFSQTAEAEVVRGHERQIKNAAQ